MTGFEVLQVRYGERVTRKSVVLHDYASYGQPDGDLPMDYNFWVLRDGDTTILVDTGYDITEKDWLGEQPVIPTPDALRLLDIDPAAVSMVVTSHFHYDHIGYLGLFTNAEIVSGAAEYEYWRAKWQHGKLAGEFATQLDAASSHLGVPVYAGGDDFLAFAPASHALDLARAVRALVDDRLHGGVLEGVTASTAVVFAHLGSPLRDVIALAQRALKDAKDAQGRGGVERDALAVVVRQRGGERARTVLPWRVGRQWATDVLDKLVLDSRAGALSARLAARLEVDRSSLDELARETETWDVLKLSAFRR